MQNIINIVLILAVVYVIYRLPPVEKMSNIDKATEDKIREIYKIDTDAIRNLSNLAKDLTVSGKLTVPGGLDLKGNISTNGHLRITKEGHAVGSNNYSMEIFTPNHADVKETSIRFHQGNKYWRQIRCDNTGFRLTDGAGSNLTDLHLNTLSATNHISASLASDVGGSVRIINPNKKTANTTQNWTIWNMTGAYGNKLSFWRYNGDGKNAGPLMDLFDAGSVGINGDLNVRGRNILAEIDEIKKNYVKKIVARYIRIGNTDMPYWHDAWTIIEAEVYNNNNVNVARGKTVKFIKGSAQLGTLAGNVVNGKIFNGRGQLHDNWSNGIHGVNGHHEIEIDLGKEQVIDHIILYNRWNDGSDWRMDGTHIKCYDSANRLLKTINTGLWHRQYSKTFTM